MKYLLSVLFFCILINSLWSQDIDYPETFKNSIQITLKFEGGYFKEEETNFGIMQGTYNAYRISKDLPKRSVLYLTKDEVYECYYNRYYIRGNCDTLGKFMAIVHFDACVNFGITGANDMLNEVIRKNHNLNDKELAIKYCDKRIQRRHDIVKRKPTKKKFLKGWLRRDRKLKTIVKKLT